MVNDLRALYGTDVPPEHGRRLTAGSASVTLEGGNLRHLRAGETELIRAVAFLVRDRDWGTLAPDITDLAVTEGPQQTHVRYRATYAAGDARLVVDVAILLAADRLEFEAEARANGDFETNRTGFTLLHPIEGVAGAPVRVDHAMTPAEDTHFPRLIAPWQPFKDITGLSHQAGGFAVDCRFEGDTFEMEDQRQWGDASFKTYVRPLALPWPYQIADGTTQRQTVRLRWHPAQQARIIAPLRPRWTAPHFPATALVLTGAEAASPGAAALLRQIAPQRLLCHFDATADHGPAELAAFAGLQAALPETAFDLELIALCPPGGDLAAEFAGHARAVAAAGLHPASIMVCPAVDRQSTPPGSDWPPCPPLTAIHAAARTAFAGQVIGGGMASFFPELNRKRPPVQILDFVTHGFCPIVHAADDLSVMETLETLPHILASAQAIIGTRDYRLGPSTIAMRQNPYGSRTIPNPGRGRVCMAEDDPRQEGRFAAAWTLGFAAMIAGAGLAVWTPAALLGPRGLFRADGTPRPVAAVVAALAACAGQPVLRAGIGPGRQLAVLAFGDHALIANLTADALPLGPLPDLPAFGWRPVSSGDLQLLPSGLMP